MLSPSRPPTRASTSLLESLNTDALIAIISASNSIADLKAFIHSSPILYECFLVAKPSILLCVLGNELGPVLKDALALSQISRLQIRQEDYFEKVDAGVQQYRHLLNGPTRIKGITLDTVISLIQYNRVIFSLVEMYSGIRLKYFKDDQELNCHWDLSVVERRRIAQALYRCQIAWNLWGGYAEIMPTHSVPAMEKVVRKITGLFEPWELEQISEINAFTHSLWTDIGDLERVKMAQSDSGGTTNDFNFLGYDLSKYGNLTLLANNGLLDEVFASPTSEIYTGKIVYTQFHVLNASHELPRLRAPLLPFDDPYVEQELDFLDESSTAPPFGWIDGHGNAGGNRWGLSLLIPWTMNLCTYEEYASRENAAGLWRWLGCVFWDRDRIEVIKSAPSTCLYSTGWLRASWD